MRCIIAGSRDVTDPAVLGAALEACGWAAEITLVVSGCARGVDTLGAKWAWECGLPVAEFPAKWDLLGRRAGIVRNEDMAEYANEHSAPELPGALIAIWDGESRGTKHMIHVAKQRGLRVYVHRTDSAGSTEGQP